MNNLSNIFLSVVWEPRHYGMVEWSLAKRGICQVYGVRVSQCDSSRTESCKLYLLIFFFLHFRLICCWKILYLPMLDYGIYRKIDNFPGSLNMNQVSKMPVYFKDISQRLISKLSCLFPHLWVMKLVLNCPPWMSKK